MADRKRGEKGKAEIQKFEYCEHENFFLDEKNSFFP